MAQKTPAEKNKNMQNEGGRAVEPKIRLDKTKIWMKKKLIFEKKKHFGWTKKNKLLYFEEEEKKRKNEASRMKIWREKLKKHENFFFTQTTPVLTLYSRPRS